MNLLKYTLLGGVADGRVVELDEDQTQFVLTTVDGVETDLEFKDYLNLPKMVQLHGYEKVDGRYVYVFTQDFTQPG